VLSVVGMARPWPVFCRLPPPTDADFAALLARVQRRVERLANRCGGGCWRAAWIAC
jgi:hypothetical protein